MFLNFNAEIEDANPVHNKINDSLGPRIERSTRDSARQINAASIHSTYWTLLLFFSSMEFTCSGMTDLNSCNQKYLIQSHIDLFTVFLSMVL